MNTFISSTPYTCLPNQFKNYILLPGASIINLPDFNKQLNDITIVNNSGNDCIVSSLSAPLINNSSVSFIPERSKGYYVQSLSSSLTPNSNWYTTGNKGLSSSGILGTTDVNDTFKILQGGTTDVIFRNSGEINIPDGNELTFGTLDISSIAENNSTIAIKQHAQLDASTLGSISGIKFINSGTTDNYYIGYAAGGTFAIFNTTSAGVHTRLMNINASNIDVISKNIVNVLDPANSQDASTKNYNDSTNLLLLPLNGSRSMTGALNMNNHLINNVQEPISSSDAATKNYADLHSGPLIPILSDPTNNASGFIVTTSAGSFGGGFSIFNNSGTYSGGNFWGPATASGGFVTIAFPPNITGANVVITGVSLGVRGGSPSLIGFTLKDNLGTTFYTNNLVYTANTGVLAISPNSGVVSSVTITCTFGSVTNSGLSFAQLYGYYVL